MRKPDSLRTSGLFLLVVLICSLVVVLLLNTTIAQAAVIFTRFVAIPGDSLVLVQWTTSSEINTNGFYVLSSQSETGVYSRISPFIPRQGSSILGANYEYVDTGLTNGIPVYYKLEIITGDLTSIFTGSISATPNLPTATPTLTMTLTPSFTFTTTITLTPSTTTTLSVTPSASLTSTTTLTTTLTQTRTITPTRTYTKIPTATRRPATAVPTRTLVRIMTATPARTTTQSGSNYPVGTEPIVTSTISGTDQPPSETDDKGSYPGAETPETSTTPGSETETSEGSFVTQGTPVPFRSPTPKTKPEFGSSARTIGWVIGIVAGLCLLAGGAWYYFRNRDLLKKGHEDLFKDDPEN